jgi:hypothetical protein
MEFKTQAQKETFERISPWMKEIFGEFARVRDDKPQYGISMGSAYSVVSVNPWGENDSTITALSWVVTEIELVPDLMKYLLRESFDMRFGAFGIDEDEDICFSQTIVGSTCDKDELKAAIMAVINVADEYDDEIIAKWGGLRAKDRK